jgi:hypothetical protein
VEESMSPEKLNKIIKQFWKNENKSDVYYLGICSEFAIALRRFLKAGTVYKAGLMHTFLEHKGYYCDIRGCFTPGRYKGIVAATSYTPATKKEIAHIQSLLEHDTVAHIIKGLKEAQREVS